MNEISYKGRGTKADEKQLMEVLDEVFFADDKTEPKINFLDLLPKLYKEKYNPAHNNLIIKENDKIKAAVGCYPLNEVAANRNLKIMGIGNVAVAKDCRGKGYMKELLNAALEIMKNENYDYSLLGGQRQRYGYFGYEPVGCAYSFGVGKSNIKHTAGKDAKSAFTAREITENDTEIIKRIKKINEAGPAYTVRTEEMMIDILNSWRSVPYAAFKGDEFKGYFVADRYRKFVREIRSEKTEDMLDLIMCAMETTEQSEVNFCLPVFDTENCEYVSKICGNSSIQNTDMLNILNFDRFIEAFLTVKAERLNLCGGTLTLLIHGCKRDENISVTVEGKNVSVSQTQAQPDIELEHREAIAFLAGLFSKRRAELPAFAQGWFPLDFFGFGLDNV